MLEKIAQHTAIYSIGNVGIRAASFLLIPLFTRTLSQRDFGLLATLLMANQVLLVFMNAGMRDTFVRFFHASREKGRAASLLGTCLLISIGIGGLLTAAILLFLTPFSHSILHTDAAGYYLGLTCALTLVQSLCMLLMSYFRTNEQPLGFLASGVSCAILLVGMNALFLGTFKFGIQGALLAYLLTYGITFSVLLVYVVSRTGLSLSKEAFGMAARFGFPLVLSQLSDISVIALPTFFLSRHHGLTPVAVFSVGQKLAQLPVPFLVLPFQLALEPMVFKNLDNADLQEKLSNMLTYFVVVFFVTTALFLGGSRLLLAAAAPESYEGADLVLAALLPTAFFLGLASFGRVLLHARLRTDITGGSGVFFACLSLVLYHFLIKRYAIHGALISANVVWLLQAACMLVLGLRTLRVPVDRRRLMIAGFALLLVCALFIASPALETPAFYGIALTIHLLGGVFFTRSGFVTDDERKAAKLFMEKCQCRLRR